MVRHPQYDRVKDSTTIWRTIRSPSADIVFKVLQIHALDWQKLKYGCFLLEPTSQLLFAVKTYVPLLSVVTCFNSTPLVPSTPHTNSCIVCRFLLIHNPTQGTRKKKKRKDKLIHEHTPTISNQESLFEFPHLRKKKSNWLLVKNKTICYRDILYILLCPKNETRLLIWVVPERRVEFLIWNREGAFREYF